MPSVKKPKIAFVVPYPKGIAPGQRFRFEQYLDFLSQHFTIGFFPFLDEETNTILYKKGHFIKKTVGILRAFIRRFFQLKHIKQYDAVFLFREASLIGPPLFEWILVHKLNKPLIFDFDDAIWLPNVSEANRFWRWLKNHRKTNDIILWSNAIMAGNEFLANYARQLNNNVYVVPTTIDTEYHVLRLTENNNKNTIIIGWTGSDTTIKHFKMSYPFLKKIKELYGNKVEIRLISNKPVNDAPFEVTFIQWKKETEILDLSAFDIGIMPLPDDEWARGKCGFKGLQYMALGIPSVMSPVGVNNQIIQHGVNGFLPSTNNEWEELLIQLIENQELRLRIGAEGRKTIEDRYSVKSQQATYLKIISEVVYKEKTSSKTDNDFI
jgi:glycosyltransferase involved in cell wall biosynthesis